MSEGYVAPEKVIHLSRDEDPRNIVGRSGIERRNRLLAIVTQLEAATDVLNSAREVASTGSIDEVVAEKIIRAQI